MVHMHTYTTHPPTCQTRVVGGRVSNEVLQQKHVEERAEAFEADCCMGGGMM
jgi:hypothetical protein